MTLHKQHQHELKRELGRERGTAAAGLRRVRIDEVEALPHQCLFVVQHHAVQIDERLGIDEDADIAVISRRYGRARAAACRSECCTTGRNSRRPGCQGAGRPLSGEIAFLRHRHADRAPRRRGREHPRPVLLGSGCIAGRTRICRSPLPSSPYFAATAAGAAAVSPTLFFFFQSPIAARIASSASTEQ